MKNSFLRSVCVAAGILLSMPMGAHICSADDGSPFMDDTPHILEDLSEVVAPDLLEPVEAPSDEFAEGEFADPDFFDGYADPYWSDLGHLSYLHAWKQEWDGSFDIGLSGSSGNSETTNLGVGLHAKREVGLNTTLVGIDYFYNQSESVVTKNRLYALGRYERAFPDSVLSWYCDFWYEKDQFASFDYRIGFHTGVGVSLLDNEITTLGTRMGLGASRAYGIADSEWLPEIQFGLDYEHRITNHQKLFATVDFYPDINDFANFRLHFNAGYELVIVEEHNLSLKLSAFDRYFSRPDPGSKRNDLDYLLALSWGF